MSRRSKKKRAASSPEAAPPSAPNSAVVSKRRIPVWGLVGASALLIVAAGLRWAAMRNPLWFDEVWSLLNFAGKARSPLDVFTYRHDNNHHLMTLWMYLCGSWNDWTIYRLPSFLAGLGTIVLASRIAWQWGWREAAAAAILTSFSLVLITYASEARGYALAGFFALIAWWTLDRYFTRQTVANSAMFSVAIILGTLAHSTIIFFYLGAFFWSISMLRRSAVDTRSFCVSFFKCHIIPIAWFVFFYFSQLRGMAIGGGPGTSSLDVIVKTLSLLLGGGSTPDGSYILAGIAGLAIVGGCLSLFLRGSSLWVLFAVTIVVGPALILFLQPSQLYPRYFYIPFVMSLILLSYVLGSISRFDQGLVPQAISLMLLLAITGNQLYRTVDFLRFGRGQYVEALDYMASHSKDGRLSLQSDHDYEMRYMLSFYEKYLTPKRLIQYHMQPANVNPAPEWTIVHGQDQPFTPHPAISDATGRSYVLVKVFPYAGLSGYHWALYQQK